MKPHNTTLVIVVVYNGMQWLSRCLRSVEDSSLPLDLYVVDNGSTDGSVEYIEREFPTSIFVRSGENLGFGAANNMGIKHAIENGYDYIYLLNQDAWISQGTIGSMIEAHKRAPQYGILSPIQLTGDGVTMDGFFERCLNRSIKRGNDLTNDIVRVKFAMAAHWLVSRECFTKVGLFSPIFYHYGEDNNYIHRANYFGFKVGVVVEAKAIHDRGSRASSKDRHIYLVKNTFLKYSSNINYPAPLIFLYAKYILWRDARRLARQYGDPSIYDEIVGMKLPTAEIRADRRRNRYPYQSNHSI